MICEKCGTDILTNYGSGRFCSAKCARSFASNTNREETNKKVSKKLKGRVYPKTSKVLENIKKARSCRLKRLEENQKSSKIENVSEPARRKRILIEQNDRCAICQIDIWNNLPIKLQLDHIDGNRSNNQRENLRMICPNCHSQTNTYCGKSKNISKKLSDEIISDCLIRNNFNIVQTLKELNLAYGGSNWHRCHRIIFEMKILDKVKQCSENGSVTQRD